MKKIFLPLLIVLGLAQGAAANTAGTASNLIAGHNFDPRTEAMAEACTATIHNSQAMFWNPAGLAKLPGDEADTSFCRGLLDDFYGHFNYAHTYSRDLTFGLGLLSYNGGGFDWVDENSIHTGVNAEVDYLLALSGAYQIDDEFAAGATLEVLHSTLVETYTAMTAALNLGATYQPFSLPQLSVGLAVRNLGLPFSYDSEKDYLPLTIQAGAGYSIFKSPADKPGHDLLAEIDAAYSPDTRLYLNLGVEYEYAKLLALRAGYKFNRDLAGLTLGAGLTYPVWKDMSAGLDYSLSVFSEFNSLHKLAITFYLPPNHDRLSADDRSKQRRTTEEEKRLQAEKQKKLAEEEARRQEAEKQAQQKQKEIEAKLPPLSLQILEQEKSNGEVKRLILNAGANNKAVVRGTMGIIYNPGHNPIGKCKLKEIYPTRTLAEVLDLNAEPAPQATVELVQ